MFHTFWD